MNRFSAAIVPVSGSVDIKYSSWIISPRIQWIIHIIAWSGWSKFSIPLFVSFGYAAKIIKLAAFTSSVIISRNIRIISCPVRKDIIYKTITSIKILQTSSNWMIITTSICVLRIIKKGREMWLHTTYYLHHYSPYLNLNRTLQWCEEVWTSRSPPCYIPPGNSRDLRLDSH